MKILIFLQSLRGGGAERAAVNLANYWVAHGQDVAIATFANPASDVYCPDARVTRFCLGLEIESRSLFATLVNNVKRILALRRTLHRFQPDAALAMMSNANVVLALAGLGNRQVVKIGAERTHPPQMPLGRLRERLRRFWYGRLQAVVALTGESANWIQENTTAREVRVIPNAVVWPLPSHEPRVQVPEPGRKILLAAGRLAPEKQFHLLIAAFAQLSVTHPDWDLAILGSGPCADDLLEAIAKHSLGGRVIMPGRVGNMADWYAVADLFVLTSRFEGFPNVLAEAMAHGCPAVSFDCDTGPRDIIRQGTDGFLVALDVAALSDALNSLMTDASLRAQLAARAIEVRDRFSIQSVSAQWLSLFSRSAA